MPARRVALLAAIGLLAGGALAFFLLPRPAASSAGTTSTLPAAAATTATWVSPREMRLGPVVIMATGLEMEGERVLLTYDVVPLTPLPADHTGDEEALPFTPAAPASFTLTYPGGAVSARAVGPTQRSGRFLMPAGFTIDQVESITIDSYWVAAPLGYSLALSPSTGAWAPAGPGMRARVVRLTEQARGYLVTVELEAVAALASDIILVGDGRAWQPASSSARGGPTWTLTFTGDALPDPVPLIVRGVGWVEVPGGGPLDLQGVPR